MWVWWKCWKVHPFRHSWGSSTCLAAMTLAVHQLYCTWFLSEMCENVSLHAPSPSVPPAPESLSASLLPNEHDRRLPRLQVSVKKEEELKHRISGHLYVYMLHLKRILQSNLVSEHKGDYFQHMHAPLLLTLRWCQKLNQVIEAAHVNGP